MSEQCMRPLPLPGGTAFCIREKGHFGPHRFPLLDGSAKESEIVALEFERLRTAVLAAIDDEPEPSEESEVMPPEVLYALRNAPEIFLNTVVVVTKRNIRARVLAVLDTLTDTTNDEEREALRSENERLRERLEALEAALWPFAREADEWDNFEGDEDLCPEIGAPDESTDEARFTVGDLRRARSLITPAPAEQTGGET